LAAPLPTSTTPANPLSASPQAINNPKMLIGEGSEEVYFFRALLQHLQITNIQIEQYGGKNNLRNFLDTLILRPGFVNVEAIAITRDADDSATSAFQSVISALQHARLPEPNATHSFTASQPRIGVFILPDGQQNGMLEDLCLASVVADIAMPCVDEFFRCVANNGRMPGNMSKAKTYAWLSSQAEPDKRLGQAALAGYWDFSHSAFDALNQFLLQL